MALAPKDYQEQCRHNWRCYDYLGGSASSFADWAMTVAFYSAVHNAKAFLVSQGYFPKTHQELERDLRRAGKSEAANHYRELYKASRRTRYECWRPNQQRVSYYEQVAKVKLPQSLK